MALSMFFRSLAVLSPNANKAVLSVDIMFTCFVLYTGLDVPVLQMLVWLGWLRYLNPLYYAFGSLVINEFSSLTYSCSNADLASNGPGYNFIANQVCAIVGSTPGQGFISGSSHIRAQYGFEQSHLGRNIDINAALFAAFAVCTGVGMEMLKLPAGRLATVFYKADPKELVAAKSSASSDPEKGEVDTDSPPFLSPNTQSAALHKGLSRREEHVSAWKDISVDIEVGGSEKRLLDNIDGWTENGQLTALMGVSGAGKTTLLNTLAGRLSIGSLSSDLLLNDQSLPKSFSRYMGYIQQQDIHLPSQTVREALQVTAHLRRSSDISAEKKDVYVETVIEMLEM